MLTEFPCMVFLLGSMDATLRDRGLSSLTTKMMCQNLFETIRASSADGL